MHAWPAGCERHARPVMTLHTAVYRSFMRHDVQVIAINRSSATSILRAEICCARQCCFIGTAARAVPDYTFRSPGLSPQKILSALICLVRTVSFARNHADVHQRQVPHLCGGPL
jgi:hypothetical protein